jgi:hypothetical protein
MATRRKNKVNWPWVWTLAVAALVIGVGKYVIDMVRAQVGV